MELLQKEIVRETEESDEIARRGRLVSRARLIFRHLHAAQLEFVSQPRCRTARTDSEHRSGRCALTGYRPITKELHRRGVNVNHKRVLRLLRVRQSALSATAGFCAQTDSKSRLDVYPTWPAGWRFQTSIQLWVAELLHPAAARVRLSRRWFLMLTVGAASVWALSRHIDTSWPSRPCAWPWKRAPRHPDLVHHSDRGCNMRPPITSHS